MGDFELSRWNHAQLPMEPAAVEPVDVVQGGALDVIETTPGAADQFSLIQDVQSLLANECQPILDGLSTGLPG
jgi:hypothetical protein